MALQGHWKLSGGVWTDSSGNGYTLTENGTMTQATGFESGSNTAVSNDGTANYLSAANPANIHGVSAFSLAWHFNPVSFATLQVILLKGASGTLEFGVLIDTSGKVSIKRSTNGTGWDGTNETDTVALSTSTNHKIIYEWDGANSYLYIDDTEIPRISIADASGDTYSGTGNWWVGINSNLANAMDGTMDDVFFFDHALSQSERDIFIGLPEDAGWPDNLVSLDYTEAPDVVSITAAQAGSVSLDYTEAPDVVSITANQLFPPEVSIDYTEAPDVVAISVFVPSLASISYTQASDVVSILGQITDITETISWDADAGDTGLTATLEIRQHGGDKYWLDFDDYTFKASGHVAPTLALTESNRALIYENEITTTGFGSAPYLFLISVPTAVGGKPKAFVQNYRNGIVETGGLNFSDAYTIQVMRDLLTVLTSQVADVPADVWDHTLS